MFYHIYLSQLRLTQFNDDLLPFLEHLDRHRLYAVLFRLILIEDIEHTHDLIRIVAVFLAIAPDRWRGNALVGGIEQPVGTERDVCPVESHGTGDIEVALVYLLAELREEFHHPSYRPRVVVQRVVEIRQTVILAEVRELVGPVHLPEVYDGLHASLLDGRPSVGLVPR